MRRSTSPGVTPQSRGVDLEVATAGEGPVDHRVLEHDRAVGAGRDRVGRDVVSVHVSGARGRPDRRGQHADGRRLARAVRAEQSEDLTGGDVEVDAAHGFDAARPGLGQSATLIAGWLLSSVSMPVTTAWATET